MSPDRVVPDPKSGRDSSSQQHNTVKSYISEAHSAYETKKNEMQQIAAELTRIRTAMNVLQAEAGRARSKYDFVPADISESLRAARQAHRVATAALKLSRALFEEEEE